MINYVTWISALMNSQILGYQNSFRPSPFGYFCQHPCVLETGRWIYTKAPYSGSKTQGLLCFPYSFRMISNPLPCNVPLFSIFLMFHDFQWSQLPKLSLHQLHLHRGSNPYSGRIMIFDEHYPYMDQSLHGIYIRMRYSWFNSLHLHKWYLVYRLSNPYRICCSSRVLPRKDWFVRRRRCRQDRASVASVTPATCGRKFSPFGASWSHEEPTKNYIYPLVI